MNREFTNEKFYLVLREDGVYQKTRKLINFPITYYGHSIIDKINYNQNKIFWEKKTETLLFIVYDPFLDQKELSFKPDKIFCYCYQLVTLFPQIKEYLQIVIKSEHNHIRYNLKDQQIISTFQDVDPKYLNLFQGQFLQKDENFYSLIHGRKLLQKYVTKDRVVRQIMNIGLLINYCEEPNYTVYYGQLNQQDQRNGRGIEFKTTWDNDNPQYTIIQGSFIEDKKKGQFLKFAGRSKNLQQLDEYENDKFIKTIEEYYPDGTIKVKIEEPPPAPAPKRRIVIMDESGVQLNTKPIKEIKVQETRVKYNQQYGLNDEKILASHSWMNSSLIDGMVMYLDRENYKQYMASENPLIFNRVLTIDSSHYTNASSDYKLSTSLRSLLYEFKGITIFDVYNEIVVVINSNNSHWLSTRVKRIFNNNQYEILFEIMDSLKGDISKYIKHCDTIFKMLQYHLELGDNYIFNPKNIKIIQVIQQNDGYSCGDHTCYFIKEIYEGSWEQKAEKVRDIRKFLYEIIIK